MNEEKLLDAFGQIEEEFIEEADPKDDFSQRKRRNMVWMKWGAMAACAVVIVAVSVPREMKKDAATIVEETEKESFLNDVAPTEEGSEDVVLEGDIPVKENVIQESSKETSAIEQSASEEAAPLLPKEELEAEMPLGQGYFHGNILEISKDFILVRCTEPLLSEFEEGATIYVSLKTVSSEPIPELTVGGDIRVLYIGDIIVTKEYIQAEKTVSIFLVDESGEVITE